MRHTAAGGSLTLPSLLPRETQKMSTVTTDGDGWTLWWDARLEALEGLFGKADDRVGHAMVPFELGPDLGGAADIVYFREYGPGVLAVTAELIGNADQTPNSMGNYELAICTRGGDEEWGPDLISRLAHYTLEAVLEPGETMDIGPAAPAGSEVVALLFQNFGTFQVRGDDAGVLLCIGLTAPELEACRRGETEQVVARLKAGGIFPYTDHTRS